MSTTTASTSLARQNYAAETEAAINKQIDTELDASQNYLYISAYFGRDTVALPGLEKFFRKQSDEEREHAQKLMAYQNKRGGKVVLSAIPAPTFEVKSARFAVELALQMEKDVNAKLLALHQVGEDQHDPQLCDFVESEFLEEQVESIKAFADMLTNLTRVGNDGLGLFLFDKDLQ